MNLLELKISQETVSLPNGIYSGVWSAWELRITPQVKVKTNSGIRGTARQKVLVMNGEVFLVENNNYPN